MTTQSQAIESMKERLRKELQVRPRRVMRIQTLIQMIRAMKGQMTA